MLKLFQRFTETAAQPDPNQLIIDGFQKKLLDMREQLVQDKAKSIKSVNEHTTSFEKMKFAHLETYFDKRIEILNQVIDSKKFGLLEQAYTYDDSDSDEDERLKIDVFLNKNETNFRYDSDEEDDADDESWSCSDPGEIQRPDSYTPRPPPPPPPIQEGEKSSDVEQPKIEISTDELLNKIDYIFETIGKCNNELDYLFFYKENSHSARNILTHELRICSNENQRVLIQYKIYLCDLTIGQISTQVKVLRNLISDVIDGTNYKKSSIVFLLKKKLLELHYSSILKEIISLQSEHNIELELLASNDLTQEEKSILETLIPATKSKLLAMKLQALIELVRLNSKLAPPTPAIEELKVRLKNLFSSYISHHNLCYCENKVPEKKFKIDSNLIGQLCQLHIWCPDKYKQHVESITCMLKECVIINPEITKPTMNV